MSTTTLYYEILEVKDFLFDVNCSGGKNYNCWVRMRQIKSLLLESITVAFICDKILLQEYNVEY